MVTAVIVQARLKSTRLPAKVLLSLPTGRSVIEEVLYRCSLIRGVDVVVAAIADDPGSDLVASSVKWMLGLALPRHAPIKIIRGPEHDVLRRHIIAAEAVGADTIIRCTSDCPLLDPEVCSQVLQAHRDIGADYTTNALPRSWPHGFDCEVFGIDLLRRAAAVSEADYPGNREGVDVWMQESSQVRRYNVRRIGDNLAHVRWTLDDIDDYVTICAEFNRRIAVGGWL